MLSDFTGVDKVFIASGYTDLRRGIDGLSSILQQQFSFDSFTKITHQYHCSGSDIPNVLIFKRE